MKSVTYKITVKINEKNLSTEAIQQAVNYISGALASMQIAHTIESTTRTRSCWQK